MDKDQFCQITFDEVSSVSPGIKFMTGFDIKPLLLLKLHWMQLEKQRIGNCFQETFWPGILM